MNYNQRKPSQLARQSGFGKGLFATLFLAAAGVAYLENSKHQHGK